MIELHHGDCLDVMKRLEENSVDAIVTDPPYELGFMGKSWDSTGIANSVEMWRECLRVLKPGGYLLSFGGTRTYHRMACAIEDAGFEVRDMIEWVYSTGFPKSLNVWKQLKKNCACGNMEAYEQGTKTLSEHNLRLVRESDISQEINTDAKQGEVLQSGLSEQSIQGTVYGGESEESSLRGKERILEGWTDIEKTEGQLQGGDLSEMSERVSTNGEERRLYNATQVGDGSTPEPTTDEDGSGASHRPQSEQQQDREPCAFCRQWGTQTTRTLGIGTALKPAHEPICMARKPISENTVAENCLKWGTGGINIDGSRVELNGDSWARNGRGTPDTMGSIYAGGKKRIAQESNKLGRFPANLIHDNSEEVRECFPETKTGKAIRSKSGGKTFGGENTKPTMEDLGYDDNGGKTSRFFKSIIYQAKAGKRERNEGCEELEEKVSGGMAGTADQTLLTGSGNIRNNMARNHHPTVKPVALMEYLINMVSMTGATILDPFMGSGTTGVASKRLGKSFIGIEQDENYINIARARIDAVRDKLL